MKRIQISHLSLESLEAAGFTVIRNDGFWIDVYETEQDNVAYLVFDFARGVYTLKKLSFSSMPVLEQGQVCYFVNKS